MSSGVSPASKSAPRPSVAVIRELALSALGVRVDVEPILDGVSTYVYRLLRGTEALYLRVLPEEGATFAPEAAAHTDLRHRGVSLPEVLYWDDWNHAVDRAVMITTSIKGTAIAHEPSGPKLLDVLRAAGRDLAILNSVPVDGFGWIAREIPGETRLRADLSSEADLMLADLDRSLGILDGTILQARMASAIRACIDTHAVLFDAPHAALAHGDFDATHIFASGGRYTGIIDLGEIRGTGPFYDLGHLHLHDGEQLPLPILPPLLEGHAEVTPLPPDAAPRIALNSLALAVDFLARTTGRLSARIQRHAVEVVQRDVHELK